MPMSYDYYHVFYYVGKYHSFTRAAQKLMSSQPNVTRAMNNLEAQLNCKLFIRSARGVELTDEGKMLYSHAEIAFEHLTLGETEIAHVNSLQSGELVIAASEIALQKELLPALKKFRGLYPGISIRIGNHSTPAALDALRKERAEVAVVSAPQEKVPGLHSIMLSEYRDLLAAGPFYAHLGHARCSVRQLVEYPWISLQRDTETFAFYDRLFSGWGLSFEPKLQAATMDQVMPMVKNNLGIAFVPEFMARRAIEAGEAFEIDHSEAVPTRAIALFYGQRKLLSHAARELIRILQEK